MLKKLTNKEFIERAKAIHGDKYNYSKVEYVNSRTKVCIICPKHGEFWQRANAHLNGQTCPICNVELKKNVLSSTKELFIEKAIKIHNNKYDYSKIEYNGSFSDVCIICSKHGEFWQKPSKHLFGHGCPKCAKNGIKITTEEFIKRAKQIHNDKYDYSKVNYINSRTKICIICPEHGEFWMTPNNHLMNHGCPICVQSKLESEVKNMLEKNNINFVIEKTFDWLKDSSNLFLDFYLPDYNIAIECQGIQHFQPVEWFGGKKSYLNQVIRDKKKKDLCKSHNIVILYYTNIIKAPKYNIKDIDILKNIIINEKDTKCNKIFWR